MNKITLPDAFTEMYSINFLQTLENSKCNMVKMLCAISLRAVELMLYMQYYTVLVVDFFT